NSPPANATPSPKPSPAPPDPNVRGREGPWAPAFGHVTQPVANVIGLGLVGGSIATGLRQRRWYVHGGAVAEQLVDQARELNILDAPGLAPDAAITFVAVPVGAVADAVKRALGETTGVVTDVGSVKAAVCAACDDPRFVGGHPMAGSELDGLAGADGDMFNGAIWVLTPTATTADTTLAAVSGAIRTLGAEAV